MPIDQNEMEKVVYNAGLHFLNGQRNLLVVREGEKKKMVWTSTTSKEYSAALFAKIDIEAAFNKAVFDSGNAFLKKHYPETLSQDALKKILDRAADRAILTYVNTWSVIESTGLSPRRVPSR